MEKLKEHRIFRNQLIICTIIFLVSSYFINELIVFGILLALLSVLNIISYNINKKDYKELLKLKEGINE